MSFQRSQSFMANRNAVVFGHVSDLLLRFWFYTRHNSSSCDLRQCPLFCQYGDCVFLHLLRCVITVTRFLWIVLVKENYHPHERKPPSATSHPAPDLKYKPFSRKVVGISVRDNPEMYCGWFWVHCSSKKFERMAREAMDVYTFFSHNLSPNSCMRRTHVNF